MADKRQENTLLEMIWTGNLSIPAVWSEFGALRCKGAALRTWKDNFPGAVILLAGTVVGHRQPHQDTFPSSTLEAGWQMERPSQQSHLDNPQC